MSVKCENCPKKARRFYKYTGPTDLWDPLDSSENYTARCRQHKIDLFRDHWVTISQKEFLIGKVMES